MKIAKIINKLEYVGAAFPHAAVRAAVNQQQAITPHLLDALRQSPREIAAHGDSYMLHIYAYYLLAQFRCAAALPALVQFFSAPGESALAVTEDFVTQDLGRVLASVCQGRPEQIYQLVENPELNQWTRAAALHGCVALYNTGQVSRQDLVTYFGELFDGRMNRQPGYWWNALVSSCGDIAAAECQAKVSWAFDESLVELDLISQAEILADLTGTLPSGQLVRRPEFHTLVDDTTAELVNWACFQTAAPAIPASANFDNVGR